MLGLTLRDIGLRYQHCRVLFGGFGSYVTGCRFLRFLDCMVLFGDVGSNGEGLGLKVSGFEVGFLGLGFQRFLGLGFQNLRVWR